MQVYFVKSRYFVGLPNDESRGPAGVVKVVSLAGLLLSTIFLLFFIGGVKHRVELWVLWFEMYLCGQVLMRDSIGPQS